MVMTDPIADMLTRIRNANMVGHEKVEIPGSNLKRAVADILKNEGFIRDAEFIPDNKRVITGLKRISKPGLRVYAKSTELPRVLGGLGIAILSTSTGIMTDKEARRKQVGGEVLCYVW